MNRLCASYIHLIYPEQSVTVDSVVRHFENFDDYFIFQLDSKTNIILFKQKRFDIKNADYITKKFKIAKVSPIVQTTTRVVAINLLNEELRHERQIAVKGTFLERKQSYECELEEKKKDMEIQKT